MNHLEGLLLLTGIPLALLLAGYWLVTAFDQTELSTRLSIALLSGITSLLLMVAAVNFFLPISGGAALLCLAPVFVTLIWGRSRRLLGRDLLALVTGRSSWGYGAVVTLFLVLLLWPALSSFTTVMYDGTSNHDSFFWITVAEHLKRHSYMERPVWTPLQPLPVVAEAVVGWYPAWGRMGAEGLIALCSAVVGLSPLKLYLYVTACLFFPWLAVAHLAIRTFYAERICRLAQVAALGFHPIFIFFYINSNLPNLFGVVTGSTAILATESALRAAWERRSEMWAWCALLVLSLHGLFCSYSEMIPFVLLPCGLLWLRNCWRKDPVPAWRARLAVAGAVVLSALINPATTFRAGWGFYGAYQSARADDRWGNIMDLLHPVQYLPAMGTLASPAAKWLGIWGGGLASVLIVGGLVLAWRRARDPWGALLAFSGGCVLLVYTLLAHFVYGWQKSVQFTGIFVSAVLSGVIVDALYQYRGRAKFSIMVPRAGMAGLVAFLVFAVSMQCRELYKWSERKLISQDWFSLRDLSRTSLNKLPVLVEAGTFRMAFFHGMWAAFFLPDSDIYYASRGEQSGGYLRGSVINESAQKIPRPAAILVSRSWAESFDANSPRILTGNEYVLLRASNRVFAMSGVFPLNGPPDVASTQMEFVVEPFARAELCVELAPLKSDNWPEAAFQVKYGEDGTMNVSGLPPWRFRIPLAAGKRNRVAIVCSAATAEALPFAFRRLSIESKP